MVSKSLIVAGATGYAVWPANTLAGALHCLRELTSGEPGSSDSKS